MRTYPLGLALTQAKCIHYDLDRPGVVWVIAGINSLEQLESAVRYYDATAGERDYSFIEGLRPVNMRGKCMYCNHCLPCPAGIDIAAVHQFLDLHDAGDALATEHYLALSLSLIPL